MKKTSAALALLGLATTLAYAQDDKPAEPRDPGVPIRLQVVFAKYAGERRLAAAPYTLSLTSGRGARAGRLRMGIQVPLQYDQADSKAAGNVVYKSVGNSVDCRADGAEGVRFRVFCTFEQSSLHDMENPARSSLAPPMLRTFSADAQLLLRDGESAATTMGTDPITGETIRIDVTLEVVKDGSVR